MITMMNHNDQLKYMLHKMIIEGILVVMFFEIDEQEIIYNLHFLNTIKISVLRKVMEILQRHIILDSLEDTFWRNLAN